MNTSQLVNAVNEIIENTVLINWQGKDPDTIKWKLSLHHSPETFRRQLKAIGQFLYFQADSLQQAIEAIGQLVAGQQQEEEEKVLQQNIKDLELDIRQDIYLIAFTEN